MEFQKLRYKTFQPLRTKNIDYLKEYAAFGVNVNEKLQNSIVFYRYLNKNQNESDLSPYNLESTKADIMGGC